MKLIVTIDVEEDNWGEFISEGYTLGNIRKIPELQCLFDRYGIVPTYLINYPVATDPYAIDLFRSLLEDGKCEIGAHCHPWNTPPFEEELNEYNSMLCNLPVDLQYRKLETLRDAIRSGLGVVPVSFRAGRWAFDLNVAKTIQELGFKVDSSVTPYTEWLEYSGVDHRQSSPHPYFYDNHAGSGKDLGEPLFVVPASVGFLQKNYRFCARFTSLAESRLLRRWRLKGLLSKFGMLNKVWLSPEMASSELMMKLVRRMRSLNHPCLNMVFHSTSLLPGFSPFVRNGVDLEAFFASIERICQFTAEQEFEPLTLSEYTLLMNGSNISGSTSGD